MSAAPGELRRMLEAGGLRPVDIALADWGLRHGGGRAGALGLALASHAVGEGHTCLRLDRGDASGAGPIDSGELAEALPGNPLVATPADTEARPLVFDGARLYLQRYWAYERDLAARLTELMAGAPEPVNTDALGPAGGLFPPDWTRAGETNWQAVAAFVAQRHRFAVISGGPGTGKTFTVVRLIVHQIAAALAAGTRPPTIALAAPTGKAAARMMASVRDGLAELQPAADVAAHLPETAMTLHRLLRLHPASTRPGHDRAHPLAADTVIVDEASMIDLPLMAKLADAIGPHGRLILLGDRYQLASVESGAVLADLCEPAGLNAFSSEQFEASGELLSAAEADVGTPALADHVVTLRTSHRFRADSPIGRLAAAINAGDAESALTVLGEGHGELAARFDTGEAAVQALVGELADAFGALHSAADAESALHHLEGLRLLCATRVGPMGSLALNERIANTLADRHGFDPASRWYPGRPVMVVQNEPRAGLYNGDVGIVGAGDDGGQRVYFRTADGVRAYHPSILPAHETAYATTIHKSQGSEFDHVHLLLPQEGSPVLTRELLYTGVTRARRRLQAIAPASVWRAGVASRVERHSGLAERLVESAG